MKMSENKEQELKPKKKRSEAFSPIFFEVGSGMGSIEKGIHWVTSVIMILLSIILVSGVLVSFVGIPNLFTAIINGKPGAMIDLLEFAATAIIGIELVYVIIAQNLESVIEILMIALTRELLIKSWDTWEIVLGIVGIGILFAVKKYLIDNRDKIQNGSH
jgi:hypothetical protein